MIAFLNWLDGVLWGVPLIALMILTGLYFTVRSGFFQFRHFGWIMKRTGGKLFQKEKEASEGKGMLSSFEAISTAIGGTVGFGNIAGVFSRRSRRPGSHHVDVAFFPARHDPETG